MDELTTLREELKLDISQLSSVTEVARNAFVSLEWLCDQRVEPSRIEKCGHGIVALLKHCGDMDAIVTCETSGLPIALTVALCKRIPLIYARRPLPVTFIKETACSPVLVSPTKDLACPLFIQRDLLRGISSVALVDSVLASGRTFSALMILLQDQDIKVAACCSIVELRHLRGRELLNRLSPETPVECLIGIDSLSISDGIIFTE